MKASKYQAAIFNWVETGTGSALVEACPGSGKTTTLVAVTDRIPRQASVAFLAFAKSTVQELTQRIQRKALIKTLHGLGFAALRNHLGNRVTVDADKVQGLITAYIHPDEAAEYGSMVRQTVAMAKSHALDPDVPTGWDSVVDLVDSVTPDDAMAVTHYARHILRLSDQKLDVVDFEDMVRLPIRLGARFPQFDWVLLDEAQDISVSQRLILHRILKAGGRVLAVGDKKQAIYSWRGAALTSMDELQAEFDCTRLPLSISYRCPVNVIDYARDLYPVIESAPQAPDGVVQCWPRWQAGDFQDGDLILCRNNAPLISAFYSLFAAGIPVRILGADQFATLRRIIKRLEPDGLRGPDGLGAHLMAWRRRQRNKFVRLGKPEKAAAVDDQAQALLNALNRTTTTSVPAFLQELKAMFQAKGSVTLSTIHRAKGLEADRVFILDPDLMPSPFAKEDWQLASEKNLEYVAITRAKSELIFIRSEDEIGAVALQLEQTEQGAMA